ncbi:MAG: tRNA (adenosine(37)-N6)-dimethylallyltransferase MiaA, partial [Deltaproteobacteria bacterium]|nr:tRNA (adenosine(37)-N6)-dimethylallyltransferase MiaA [Deltaproteobacteria bacterium]
HQFRQSAFPCLKIGLSMARETLYERIDKRVGAMIETGLAREVRMLLDKGYSASLKSMQSIGYRHMAGYLLNHQSWGETVRTLKRDTRRYAKRQMTWFKTDAQIHWAAPSETDTMDGLIEAFLNRT